MGYLLPFKNCTFYANRAILVCQCVSNCVIHLPFTGFNVSKIEIIPLGGIGEFGMNCMGIRYRDEMIIVDAGMGFPEETPFGVDISIPNFAFLEEYRDDLTAIILTHGHEDHVGALAYILKKFNVPVYGSRFTLALAEKRLEEFRMLEDVLLHRVKANDVID